MLPFQVGAIDPNRLGVRHSHSQLRGGPACGAGALWRRRVNHPYRGAIVSVLLIFLLAILAPAGAVFAGKEQEKGKGGKKRKNLPELSGSPGEQSLTNIPLPVGHEAKGLVLPDFDANGHLLGKFEAGTARRIDQERIGFENLKITTFTPENRPDVQIEMRTSVLDLKTRILTSRERTTIQRADFNIAGDSVEFDTKTRTGKLIGNVKMVITDQSQIIGKPNE